MSWNDVLGKQKGRENHIEIKPEQSVKVHVLLDMGEEPVSYWTHFIKGKGSVICPGKTTCPACAQEVRAKRSHALNVYDYATDSVKILEQGNSVMQQIKLILDQIGDLNTVDLSIRRVGEGLNTQYIVIPLPLTQPFSKPNIKKLDIASIKTIDSAEKINALMTGAPPPQAQPVTTINQIQLPTTSAGPAPNQIGEPGDILFSFGKYKGEKLSDVAHNDMNYIKWCAENIGDERVKSAAKALVNAQTVTAPPEVSNSGGSPTDESRSEFISAVNKLINEDERYKGKINVVIEKMKEATATADAPKGKMLLQDYSMDELDRLLSILAEGK